MFLVNSNNSTERWSEGEAQLLSLLYAQKIINNLLNVAYFRTPIQRIWGVSMTQVAFILNT